MYHYYKILSTLNVTFKNILTYQAIHTTDMGGTFLCNTTCGLRNHLKYTWIIFHSLFDFMSITRAMKRRHWVTASITVLTFSTFVVLIHVNKNDNLTMPYLQTKVSTTFDTCQHFQSQPTSTYETKKTR